MKKISLFVCLVLVLTALPLFAQSKPPSQLDLQRMELRALIAEIANLRTQLDARTQRAQQLQALIQEAMAKQKAPTTEKAEPSAVPTEKEK